MYTAIYMHSHASRAKVLKIRPILYETMPLQFAPFVVFTIVKNLAHHNFSDDGVAPLHTCHEVGWHTFRFLPAHSHPSHKWGHKTLHMRGVTMPSTVPKCVLLLCRYSDSRSIASHLARLTGRLNHQIQVGVILLQDTTTDIVRKKHQRLEEGLCTLCNMYISLSGAFFIIYSCRAGKMWFSCTIMCRYRGKTQTQGADLAAVSAGLFVSMNREIRDWPRRYPSNYLCGTQFCRNLTQKISVSLLIYDRATWQNRKIDVSKFCKLLQNWHHCNVLSFWAMCVSLPPFSSGALVCLKIWYLWRPSSLWHFWLRLSSLRCLQNWVHTTST